MTNYDYIHVGHARMLTVFDLIQRYLRSLGYAVTYVRNVTDIDDKIIERAAAKGENWADLARRFTAAMHEDCATLGLQSPDLEPRATEYIAPIIAMTQTLIDKGYAYVAVNGDVMYAVRKFAKYGRLSGKKIDDLRAGSRIQVDEAKLDPLDFVLWKHAKPGEPSWASPWGEGRPGWHIECSAMSTSLLGSYFDIHGGGEDLKFPHHENEIAQSCAACDSPFVHVWMHNGFVRVNDEKMSKSLGNFFTVREVLKTLRDPEVLRFFLLSSHYRGPINYSTVQLAQADETLLGLYRALKDAGPSGPVDAEWLEQISRCDGRRFQYSGSAGGHARRRARAQSGEGRGKLREDGRCGGDAARHERDARRTATGSRYLLEAQRGRQDDVRCRHRSPARRPASGARSEKFRRIRSHSRPTGRRRNTARGQGGRRNPMAARLAKPRQRSRRSGHTLRSAATPVCPPRDRPPPQSR